MPGLGACTHKHLAARFPGDGETDKMKEACGVFGALAPAGDLSRTALYALYALQHRGQEGAGIALSDGKKLYLKKGMGLVSEVFPNLHGWAGISAQAALGHVRCSVNGDLSPENSQPLLTRYRQGNLAVAHNGSIVNAEQLRGKLEKEGSLFQTTTDSEIIAHLVARSGSSNLQSSLKAILPSLQGAYAFVFLTEDKLVGLRDPHGIRPLSLGRWRGNYVIASETCAFDTIGAETIRDINPGEMVTVTREGLESTQFSHLHGAAFCIFEFIYFARPDSNLQGQNVHLVRKALGRRLALEQPVQADLVTGVPDSSLSAASGFAEKAGLPYEMGLIKNRYIGRTFFQPNQEMRSIGVQLKLNPIQKLVAGKRIVVIDDSLVRGTTSRKMVKMFFKAGAREVHMRIASPPVISPCYYGINTPDCKELLGFEKQVEAIRREIGATTLGYLSREGMLGAVGLPPENFCTACFSGKYPI